MTLNTDLGGCESITVAVPHYLTGSSHVMVACRLPPDDRQGFLQRVDTAVHCADVTLTKDNSRVRKNHWSSCKLLDIL